MTFSHVFSSDLQRAQKTAEALLASQTKSQIQSNDHLQNGPVSVVQDLLLREQDFGFFEGKPFYAREHSSSKSGKHSHWSQHANEPSFQDVESKESMRKRADEFVHGNLISLLCDEDAPSNCVVAIYSHGIILNHLWKSIFSLFGKNAVSLAPGVSVGNAVSTPLEYLGGWSNTGYLELDISPSHALSVQEENMTTDCTLIEKRERPNETADDRSHPIFPNLKMRILAVNGKDHLRALKRTRGVGSAAHDESQRKIENFFKKPRKG